MCGDDLLRIDESDGGNLLFFLFSLIIGSAISTFNNICDFAITSSDATLTTICRRFPPNKQNTSHFKKLKSRFLLHSVINCIHFLRAKKVSHQKLDDHFKTLYPPADVLKDKKINQKDVMQIYICHAQAINFQEI